MSAPRKFDPLEILALYRAGHTRREIARIIGCGKTIVEDAVRLNPPAHVLPPTPQSRISPRQRVVRLQATTDYRTWVPATGYINNHLYRMPVSVAALYLLEKDRG